MTNEEFIKSVSLEGEEWRDVVGYEGGYRPTTASAPTPTAEATAQKSK